MTAPMTDDPVALAREAGEKYLAWIEANNLESTDQNFQAFIAGWTLSTSALYAPVEALREALTEVMQWIAGWDPNFIYDDEWPATSAKVPAATYLETLSAPAEILQVYQNQPYVEGMKCDPAPVEDEASKLVNEWLIDFPGTAAGITPGAFHELARRIARRLRASHPVGVTVPRDPTPEMLAAALPLADAAIGAGVAEMRLAEMALGLLEKRPMTNEAHQMGLHAAICLIYDYRNMIAAAPSASTTTNPTTEDEALGRSMK